MGGINQGGIPRSRHFFRSRSKYHLLWNQENAQFYKSYSIKSRKNKSWELDSVSSISKLFDPLDQKYSLTQTRPDPAEHCQDSCNTHRVISLVAADNSFLRTFQFNSGPLRLPLVQLQRVPERVLPVLRRLRQPPVRTSPGSGLHLLGAGRLQLGYRAKRAPG